MIEDLVHRSVRKDAVQPRTQLLGTASRQRKEDFVDQFNYDGKIREPPYSLPELARMSEVHPIHAAALEQKATDVVSNGFDIEPMPNSGAEKEQYDRIMNWWNSLFVDAESIEVLLGLQLDIETLGWGALELVRDERGTIRNIWRVHAHTIRVHEDDTFIIQIRHGINSRHVYFKRWHSSIDPTDKRLKVGGGTSDKGDNADVASEIMLFTKGSRWSIYYGVPTYIAALGDITKALAIRDYTIALFSNYREPRHLITITGINDVGADNIAQSLAEVWAESTASDPAGNIFFPIEGDASVNVESLSPPTEENTMMSANEEITKNILIAHRMPPERLGVSAEGFFGSHSLEQDQIYRNSVVRHSQSLLESRLTSLVRIEYQRTFHEEVKYQVRIKDLELLDAFMDRSAILELKNDNMISINDARQMLKLPYLEKFGDLFVADWEALLARRETQEDWAHESLQEEIEREREAEAKVGDSGGDFDF